MGHLVILDGNGASVYMLKQASAFTTLLKEAASLESNFRLGFLCKLGGEA